MKRRCFFIVIAFSLFGAANLIGQAGNAKILHESRTLEIKSDGRMELTVSKSTLIFNENSGLETEVILYGPDAKINYFNGIVYNQSGKVVREYGAKDVIDVSASAFSEHIGDSRYQRIDFYNSEYPFVIETNYQIRMNGFSKMMNLEWRLIPNYYVSLDKASFEISVPRDFPIEILSLNFNQEVIRSQESNRDLYQLNIDSISAVSYESDGPPRLDVLPAVWIFPGEFKVGKYEGSLGNWESYGLFLKSLMEDRMELPDDLQKRVQEEVFGATTDQEKIDRLYRFMQSEMRYVSIQLGIGGWQPLSAEYVYEHKYGDCKALTNYMASMLQEVGIKAEPVVIYRGAKPSSSLDNEFPTFAFNHMLLYVPSESCFLECTSSSYPSGYIGSDNENRRALLVTESGGQLIDMPKSEASANREHTKSVVRISANGQAEIKIETSFSGDRHQYYRYLFNHADLAEQSRRIHEDFPLSGFEIQDWMLSISEEKPEAQLDIECTVPRFCVAAGKRLFVSINPLNCWEDIPPENAGRANPIYIQNGFVEEDEVVFHLPSGYEIEALPTEEYHLEEEFGSFHWQIKKTEKEVTLIRKLTIEGVEISPADYESYRQFYIELSRIDKEKMVLVKKRA